MASQKIRPKTNLKTILSQKLSIKLMYILTKAKNGFKKPKDTSGVELLNFENFELLLAACRKTY